MDGVTAETITTDRITTRVLCTGPEDSVPVLFLHGNFSSATWWEETMLAQTRAVLDRYAAAGSSYQEVIIQNAAHIPFWSLANFQNAHILG
ncbi:MAG: hypothetical protein DRJ03_06315 [Chloroflexi bacterium]|nr:MAG: hypothetical protein DRJ03_06315 [Chloroflexota bacterium]